IEVLARTSVAALAVDSSGQVVGVESDMGAFTGGAVVLATGGYAGLWARTTNPAANRGKGLEMAWRAGATLADLELIQFHPTALDLPHAPAYLLSEALRGEGARLVNIAGEEVVDPLLSRDVVARAIYNCRRDHGPVYLSLRHLDPAYVHSSFPAIEARLRRWGLELTLDLLPVSPAAHYCMGGVRTDTDGRTDLPGLYAAGEVACTGVQGANRLASNSLLECLVFGRSAALAALSDNNGHRIGLPVSTHWKCASLEVEGGSSVTYSDPQHGTRHDAHQSPAILGRRLQCDLGVERNGRDLKRLVNELPLPTDRDYSDDGQGNGRQILQSSLVAALAARSALIRTESRGAHYRSDYPDTSARWRGRILWQRRRGVGFEEVM
ncbi:MAG: FAD-binding protein, partial [Chloroflexota bacterium]|nr:FAD-binding protein [Chloroflexota bacterium]